MPFPEEPTTVRNRLAARVVFPYVVSQAVYGARYHLVPTVSRNLSGRKYFRGTIVVNRTVLTALLPVALASLAVPASAQTEPVFPCLNPPAIVSAVPADSPIADQNSLNCFAWQEFIALNWTAKAVNLPAGVDAKAYFGRPGDYTPTVWETYSDIHDVFQPDGVPPPSFGQLPETPTTCYGGNGSRRRVLTRTSKFSVEVDIPEDIAEAFPFDGSPNWLADKDGNQVYYEIMINKDEYDYIVQNELYNALTGYLLSAGGQHVDLPRGLLGGGKPDRSS